jgi:hypothetical protein
VITATAQVARRASREQVVALVWTVTVVLAAVACAVVLWPSLPATAGQAPIVHPKTMSHMRPGMKMAMPPGMKMSVR